MKSKIRWMEQGEFAAESESGHTVTLSGPPELGGRNLGMRPMEMLLLGMGGCTAVDVISIAQKARQQIVGFELELTAERAEHTPKVFTKIHLEYVFYGSGLQSNHLERAIALSLEKYCSAIAMLSKTASISHSYRVLPAEALLDRS